MKRSASFCRFTCGVCLIGGMATLLLSGCGPRFMARDDEDVAGRGGASSAGEPASASNGGRSTLGGAGGAPRTPSKAGESASGGTAEHDAPPSNGGASSGAGRASGGAGGKVESGGVGGSALGDAGGNEGGASTAGSAGSGGAPAHCSPLTLIDDMEDGDDRSCFNQQRNGEWWSATGTQTGSIDPPTHGNFPAYLLGADARGSSRYGMRLSGVGFGHTDADWASLGFNLIDDAAYDLTAHTGVAFYAKSRATSISLHVEFATDTTTALAEGGACTADCNDHYATVVPIDGTWREYSVPLTQLLQEGWGPKAKDLAHTRFIYFGFLGTDNGPAEFDFLIDDVRLY